MLQNVNDKYSTDSSKSNDFNYSVSVYKQDTTTNPVGSIVVEHDTVLLPLDISKRTIKVYPAVNSKKLLCKNQHGSFGSEMGRRWDCLYGCSICWVYRGGIKV